jgi:oxygen-independent coproporphyrinogen III oxidase
VHATSSPPVDPWLQATAAELEARTGPPAEPQPLDTLYVGGGTPSVLGVGAMARLRAVVEKFYTLALDAEWTVEANPESFDEALARDWVAAGVNRVSLGAQTFHAPALKWMGRLHGPDGPARAVAAARAAGLDNVSLDLIFGLPDDLGRDWAADLERTLALEPTHVSLYGLTAEPGAPLGRWVREGRTRLPDEESYGREYRQAAVRLGSAGYEHYEVSNFARPGHASRHNRAYWLGTPYLGLGVGAHSYMPPRRWWNLRDWAAYANALAAGTMPVAGEESVDAEAASLERTWLGLRTADGLEAATLTGPQRSMAAGWVRQGWARMREDRLQLTVEGWLLLDRLAVELEGAGRESPAPA